MPNLLYCNISGRQKAASHFSSDISTTFFIPNDRQLAQNEYDSHIPMGSLAKYLRTSRGEFVKASPTKLKADTLSSEKIRQAFRIGDKHLMGISWRSVNKATGLMRSVSLSDFLKPLKGRILKS